MNYTRLAVSILILSTCLSSAVLAGEGAPIPRTLVSGATQSAAATGSQGLTIVQIIGVILKVYPR